MAGKTKRRARRTKAEMIETVMHPKCKICDRPAIIAILGRGKFCSEKCKEIDGRRTAC